MEESKELQGFYKIFRAVIYISVLMEFFEYAIDPRAIDGFGGVVCDLHDRIKQWFIYHDGNLVYSKVVTFLLVCITCVGTRNKKHLEFDARRQVLYPLVSGVLLLILSVWIFGYVMDTRLYALRLNTILYMVTTIIGTVLVHVALDNISKFLKEGLMKDRFNFENESFEQCQKEEYNKYSVNIPMRYYYKGKFRKGWVNIVNPFRGTWVVGTPVAVRHSPSSSRLSVSTVQKALPWSFMTTSFLPWQPNCTITTRRTNSWANCQKAASSTSSTSWMWNTPSE